MRIHLWQGQAISHDELISKLEHLDKNVDDFLLKNFDFDLFVESCDAFSRKLKSESEIKSRLIATLTVQDGLSSSVAEEIINLIADFISKKQIKFKISNELNSATPFSSQRIKSDGNIFEKWEPLGLIVQILSGNDYALPVLSAFEGLMTGNVNILKMSHNSSGFTHNFFTEFANFSQTARWKNRICIVNISSKERALLDRLYSFADGVVAWGGEEAINDIRKSIPPSARLIDWGHKISFSYLTKTQWQNKDTLKSVVHDIFVFNQQACSSPQCVYLEDANFQDLKEFSENLSLQMNSIVLNYPENDTSDMENAEIAKMGMIVKTEKSLLPDYAETIEDTDGKWRIWIDSRSSLRASPLYKTIWVKPIHRKNIVKTFRPMRQYHYGTGRCDFPAGSAGELYHSVHDKIYKLPEQFRVFVGHDYQPKGRPLAFESTIGEEKRKNIQLNAETTKESFVEFRNNRDKMLAAPRLLLPSVQVNIDAGQLPKAEENGTPYLKIPVRE